MSNTIDIVCMDCRESLWIGQIYRGEGHSHLNLYADQFDRDGDPVDGEQGDTQKQRRFYAKHMGHVLMVTHDEATTDIADNEFEHDEDGVEGPVEYRNLDDSEWRDTVNAGIERIHAAKTAKADRDELLEVLSDASEWIDSGEFPGTAKKVRATIKKHGGRVWWIE